MVDVYESATHFVLVGHDGLRRHILHVDRQQSTADKMNCAFPPVSEDSRSNYSTTTCAEQLANFSAANASLVCVLRGAPALLGMVRFLEGWYMLFVIQAEVAGTISGRKIYRVEETAMLSINNLAKQAPHSALSTSGNSAINDATAAVARKFAAHSTSSSFSPSFRRSTLLSWKALYAAATGLAPRLQLSGWPEEWAEIKCESL